MNSNLRDIRTRQREFSLLTTDKQIEAALARHLQTCYSDVCHSPEFLSLHDIKEMWDEGTRMLERQGGSS